MKKRLFMWASFLFLLAQITLAQKPDLFSSYLSVPTNLRIGEKIPYVTFKVANRGDKAAGSFYVSLYIANNSSSLSGAHFIGKFLIQSLRAHEDRTIRWNVNYTVPTSVPQGYRYLVLIVDSENGISESNEANNKRLMRVRIAKPLLPDLVSSYLSGPTNLRIGEKISQVTFRVANIGDKAAGSFYVSLHLANNASSLSRAHFIGKYLIHSLRAHDSRNIRWTVNYTVPESVPQGYRYLALFVDSTKRIAESNETNNKLLKRVRIVQTSLPDLVSSYLSGPTNLRIGDKISQITFTLSNIGDKVAGSFYVSLYLANNTTSSFSRAYLIGRYFVNSMEAHENRTIRWTVNYTVPTSVSQGYRYLALFVDSTKRIAERNESNNRRFMRVRISQ